MSDSKTRLRRFILEAVANDYERFDSIMGDVRAWSGQQHEQFSEAEIREGVMRLVRDGSIAAYELSSQSEPCRIAVEPQKIHSAWFYISPNGKYELAQRSRVAAAAI